MKKDLESQVLRCEEFCRVRGYSVSKIYKEVASGMNDKQINRIPTDGIVEVVIELNSFRRFRIFPEGVLRNKIVDKFSALGVQVRVIDSSFNSQRCSLCGFTNSKNRKGSSFKCMNCQSEDDADKNACKNLLMELPDARSVPLLISNYRTSGFFWNPEGIIPVRDHSEPTVPN